MTILRVNKTERFSIISNVHLNDTRLSWKATAILTYLLSRPNDWTVHVEQLAKTKKCGIKAVFSGVKELKEYGYIEHVFIRDENGRMARGEYIVHEEPISVENPVNTDSVPYAQNGHTVKRHTVNPHAENRRLLNTDRIPSTEFTKNDDDIAEPQTPLPADPPPEVEKPSSSFSFDVSLLPEQFRESKLLQTRISKALEKHGKEYVNQTLMYASDHSTASTASAFGAFFGRALDGGWGEGYDSSEDLLGKKAKINRLMKEEQEQDRKRAEEQARWKRMHEALDQLQQKKPEEYARLEKQAADALGLNLKRLKSVIGGRLKIRHKMFELMGV